MGCRHRWTPRYSIKYYTVLATAILSYSVMANYTLNVDANINHAVALGQIPWILQALRSIFLDRNQKHLKVPLSNDLIPLLASPCFMYAGWNNVAPAALLFAIIQLINGLSIVTNPEMHSRAWGDATKVDTIVQESRQALGFGMLGLGTFVLVMYLGFEPTKAFGYSWISFVGMTLLPFVNDSVKEHKLSPGAILVWVPIGVLAVGACCL
jgi:hypothetical protein